MICPAAHTDPAWPPARNHASSLRLGIAFIDSGGTEISAVVTALHHASDALARTVSHDREGVRSAAATEDLYVPTRLLPADNEVPYRYAPAPSAMLDELLATYDTVTEAAMRAASTLDRLVVMLNPQPTPLTALRAVAPLNTPCPPHNPGVLANPPAKHPAPGQVEQALRNHGVSEPALLAHAAELDDKTTALIGTAASISQRRANASGAAKHAREARPPDRPHPARLAAEDSSPAASAATSLPRLVPISHQIRHSTPARRRPDQWPCSMAAELGDPARPRTHADRPCARTGMPPGGIRRATSAADKPYTVRNRRPGCRPHKATRAPTTLDTPVQPTRRRSPSVVRPSDDKPRAYPPDWSASTERRQPRMGYWRPPAAWVPAE